MLYSTSRSYHLSSPSHCRPEGDTQRSAADTQQSLPVFGQYKTEAFPLIKSTFPRLSGSPKGQRRGDEIQQNQIYIDPYDKAWTVKNHPASSHGPTLPSPSMSIKLISLCAWHLSTYFNCFIALSGQTHAHLSSPHSIHFQCPTFLQQSCSWNRSSQSPAVLHGDFHLGQLRCLDFLPRQTARPLNSWAPFAAEALCSFSPANRALCKRKTTSGTMIQWSASALRDMIALDILSSDSVCCMLIIFI